MVRSFRTSLHSEETASWGYDFSTFRQQIGLTRLSGDCLLYSYKSSSLEEISTDWLRSNLRLVLEQVNFHSVQYAILRRGRSVAGIVPIAEAHALFEATRADRKYRDKHRDLKTQDKTRLREAVTDMAGHDATGRRSI